MDKEGFHFKHISKEDFHKTYKKLNRDRQKLLVNQHCMESIKESDSNKTYSVHYDTEVKQIKQSSNKYTNSQFSSHNSTDIYHLHDPYDLNHIHGLRNRLFKTFNEFANILENALLPPVLKSTKKVKIKLKECDQQANNNYIFDLSLLLSEIKKESKNENLHNKKNKTNVMLRKTFQIKLIQCYKLAINTVNICSRTLEASIYNPIQSKMKMLIQLISVLSSTTGKYIYGVLFKKKKKESFDLVQRCKVLENMLDECGYKDTENEYHSNNYDTLNELATKALNKTKTQPPYANSYRLSMYDHVKPKFGSNFAHGLSKKSFDCTTNDLGDKHSFNSKMVGEDPLLLKTINNSSSINMLRNHDLDNVKTAIQDYPFEELNEANNNMFFDKMEKKILMTEDESNLQAVLETSKSNELKTCNVRLDIIKENTWRNFPMKNIKLSQNGCILLNIPPEHIENNYLYKRQFKSLSIISENEMENLSDVTESIMDDLIYAILSKIDYDAIIKDLIRMELFE